MRWSRAPVTLAVTATILAAFAAEYAVRFTDPTDDPLIVLGAIVPHTLDNIDWWWRLVAATFLHAGVMHLLLNLWVLVQVGFAFETLFRSRRFAVAYGVTGFFASLVSAVNVKAPGSVGASGAIFGVTAAFVVMLFRSSGWRSARWARRLAVQLAVWSVIAIGYGLLNPRVDNAAHLGGATAGVVVGAWFTRQRSPRAAAARRTPSG